MVIFNELRLSSDKSNLIVDCFIEGLAIYNDMWIKSVYIEYYKNALASGDPSENAIQVYNNEDEITTIKAVRTCLSYTSSQVADKFGIKTFDDGLFYVIVDCGGTPAADTSTYPCGYDETRTTGVILDWQHIYEYGMQYISQVAHDCANPCMDMAGLDNFIITWNTLKLAVSTCDFTLVEKVYMKFLRYAGIGTGYISSGCGCGK